MISEIMEIYEVRIGEDLVFSGDIDDAMDYIEDLSEEYKNTGDPHPDTVKLEMKNGEG
tara:strand:+ start:377 stop:550 length:174 start_codon:yes stop_codon:yes gene_type:complete